MISVDPRAGSNEYLRPIALLGSSTRHETLDFGDFAFWGNGPRHPVRIGVELKTLSDFLDSLESGRLTEQVKGMGRTYDYRYLLIQGIWRVGAGDLLERPAGKQRGKTVWGPVGFGTRRYLAAELRNARRSLEVQGGVWTDTARDPYETAYWIHSTYQWWQKPWEGHKTLKAVHLAPVSRRPLLAPRTTRARRFAAETDGVGAERSLAVARAFPTGEKQALATVQEWQQVLGKVLGRKAWECWRRED